MSKGPSKFKSRLFTVVFMFMVTFVCIAVVAAIHLASYDRVAGNESLYKKEGIMAAAGLSVPEDSEAVLDWYARCVTAVPNEEAPVYYAIRADEGGARTAMVFMREGAGLWGTIEAVVGMDPALNQFTGIAFVKQNETPGLGARIMEPWYRAHIRGKTGGLTLVSEKSGSGDPTKLDAITGATVTSQAVRDILNGLSEDAPQRVASVRMETHGTDVE